MTTTTENIYAVLFQYSPNGNKEDDPLASIEGGRFYRTKADACSAVKAKLDEILTKERAKGCEMDKEWGEQLTFDDLRLAGYSWESDFSKLGFEAENKYDDVPPEPKYSWTVVELTCPGNE